MGYLRSHMLQKLPPVVGMRSVSASKGLIEGKFGLSDCITIYFCKGKRNERDKPNDLALIFFFFFAIQKGDPPASFHADHSSIIEIFTSWRKIGISYPVQKSKWLTSRILCISLE
jgi:hypothetical protein